MPFGDVIVLDNAHIEVEGTDISVTVAQVRLQVMHVVAQSPHTMQRRVQTAEASRNYSWTVELDFVTDTWGANSVDDVFADIMWPPLGPVSGTPPMPTGDAKASIIIRPDAGDADDDNPQYSGTILVDQWEPLGDGTATEIVRQTRTFSGVTALVVTTDSS